MCICISGMLKNRRHSLASNIIERIVLSFHFPEDYNTKSTMAVNKWRYNVDVCMWMESWERLVTTWLDGARKTKSKLMSVYSILDSTERESYSLIFSSQQWDIGNVTSAVVMCINLLPLATVACHPSRYSILGRQIVFIVSGPSWPLVFKSQNSYTLLYQSSG